MEMQLLSMIWFFVTCAFALCFLFVITALWTHVHKRLKSTKGRKAGRDISTQWGDIQDFSALPNLNPCERHLASMLRFSFQAYIILLIAWLICLFIMAYG